jgi:hypothetical protein
LIFVKIHSTPAGKILAMCDEELIGKIFREGEAVIDLQKYKNFYIGEKKDEKEIKEILDDEITSINAVGERSVNLLINNSLATKKDVKRINGIAMLQIFFIK